MVGYLGVFGKHFPKVTEKVLLEGRVLPMVGFQQSSEETSHFFSFRGQGYWFAIILHLDAVRDVFRREEHTTVREFRPPYDTITTVLVIASSLRCLFFPPPIDFSFFFFFFLELLLADFSLLGFFAGGGGRYC